MNEETAPLAETGILPEPCPTPIPFTVEGCQDAHRVSLPATVLTSLGRIVQLDVTLKSVCPGKRIAVSVLLSELDARKVAHPRGVKHMLVPAQTGEGCRDLTLRCIQFSLPEALDPDGNPDSICSPRHLQAQVIANYVDTDYVCCDAQVTGI